MRLRRAMTVGILLLVLSGAVGACSGGAGDISAGDGDAGAGGDGGAAQRGLPDMDKAEAPYALDDSGVVTSEGAVVGSGGDILGSAAELPSVSLSVIKTATMRLELERDGLDQAAREAIAIAERFGGYVSTTALRDARKGTGSLELRVPATRFGDALEALRGVGKVQSESVAGQDVGQEFVDLQARLRNFEAQETVLLRLMDKSVSVADTLRVQGQLQQVQLEIERLRGRIRYLQDQTDMSTIRVDMTEEGIAPTSANAIVKAWRQAREVAVGVVAAVIVGAGFVVPVALLLAVIGLVVFRLRPRTTTP